MKIFPSITKQGYSHQFARRGAGFTLIELMVSLSVFVVVMFIVMGSILSILDLNNKSQSKKTATDNLNFALESMTRTVKFSTNFHCGAGGTLSSPTDCASGSSSLSITSPDGVLITYALSNGAIMQTSGGNTLALTSSEVVIQTLTFYVLGSLPPVLGNSCPQSSSGDCLQPRVIVVVSGYAGGTSKTKLKSSFNLETTVSQRKLDI